MSEIVTLADLLCVVCDSTVVKFAAYDVNN